MILRYDQFTVDTCNCHAQKSNSSQPGKDCRQTSQVQKSLKLLKPVILSAEIDQTASLTAFCLV